MAEASALIKRLEEFFEVVETYKKQLDILLHEYPKKRSLAIDYKDLERFDPQLADELIEKPDLITDSASIALQNLVLHQSKDLKFEPHVRFFNLGDERDVAVEEIGADHIQKLIKVKGVITKRAEVRPKVKVALLKCKFCDATYKIPITKNTLMPDICESCKRRSLRMVDEESYFVNLQRAEVQEMLERLRGGSPASHIELWLEDDLVNTIIPGDNVEITGILRIRPPTKVKGQASYSKFLDVVHVLRVQREFEEVELTEQDIEKITTLSKDPDIFEKIAQSLAPGIYGHEEVKRALTLQLFGGTPNKELVGGGKIRNDIHLLLIGDPGAAKCVDGDTKVILADGSIDKIRDVVETELSKACNKLKDEYYAIGNHDILSLDLDCKVTTNKATVFHKIKAPNYLYEIETATGKKVIVTPEHPFFIYEKGFVKSKITEDIVLNEFIATPHYLPFRGKLQELPKINKGNTNASHVKLPKYLTSNFARLLGYLIGDGYVRRTTSYEISLSNTDKILLSDFEKILRSFHLPIKLRIDKRNGVNTLFCFSIELGKILESMGVAKRSAKKKIPTELLKSPNRISKEFIKTYFDCEASVTKRGDIVVTSASQDLLEKVQVLLLRSGIISQLHKTTGFATNTIQKIRRTYYRLRISGKNTKIFLDEIGFSSSKRQKLQNVLKSKEFNTNIDIIPNLKDILKQTRQQLGLTQFECGVSRATYQHFERGDRNPSRSTFKKIIKTFQKFDANQNNKNIKLLSDLSNSHIFWDRIIKKRKISPRHEWVYDLQVDPTHNFIANGMFIHNTRFLQYVANIAPKSIYVSGKSVSGVGLTASADRDEESDGGWVLKAGALVLASGGNACIDEFDKIDDKERAALHEVMESQSYHPSTKLLLANGQEVEMGPFVEKLLTENNHKTYLGKDCVILDQNLDGIKVLTTDFKKIYPTAIFQVSKHKAPFAFIKITLQTRRTLIVTQEHPVWVTENGRITTKSASEIKKGDLTLMPSPIPANGKEITECEIKMVQKIKNTDTEWVYDVGVKPTEAFISECAILHNSVSVAKAGIVAKFKAKTSILAAANPKYGRFDPNELPTEQFNIEPTLLSRFDLIFSIRDILDPEKDTRLAEHILTAHKNAGLKLKGKIEEEKRLIDETLLRKYVAYARKNIHPTLSDEAENKIKEYYIELRKIGMSQGAVPITPRQIEGLIRLSEAGAKTRLSNRVELADAERAIKLVDFVLRQISLDRQTGRLDIDIISTGQPKSKVEKTIEKHQTILEIIKDLQSKFDLVEVAKVIEAAKEYNVDEPTVKKFIDDKLRQGELYEPKHGYIKIAGT